MNEISSRSKNPAAAARIAIAPLDDVSTFTSVLNKRSSNIDSLLVDSSELAHKLNMQADRLDNILKNVENFTGNGKNGFMTDLSEAAKSVRTLADSLNHTAPGTLKDYQSLASDARRSISEIERVARSRTLPRAQRAQMIDALSRMRAAELKEIFAVRHPLSTILTPLQVPPHA